MPTPTDEYLIIQWYHKDGSYDGLASPVGFATVGTLKAFIERLDRFNVLYKIVYRSDTDEWRHNDSKQVD